MMTAEFDESFTDSQLRKWPGHSGQDKGKARREAREEIAESHEKNIKICDLETKLENAEYALRVHKAALRMLAPKDQEEAVSIILGLAKKEIDDGDTD